MDFSMHDSRLNAGLFIQHQQNHQVVDHAPDSPIDLSQLSSRYRSVDLSSRSVSESCLAPAAAAAKKRRIQGFKDPLPPPFVAEHRVVSDSLKYRSMSHADISGYRAPWIANDLPESSGRIQPKLRVRTPPAPAPPPLAPESAISESLKFRCMSDSRLGGPNHVSSAFHPTPTSAIPSGRKNFMSNGDVLRTPSSANENSQLEFLLRRTASESFLPSSRSGEPAGSAAMEMFVRQQQMIQHHYQQLLIQQQQDGSDPGSSSSSSSSSYLSSASPWLLGLFGYGYSQMLQSFQATQQQQLVADSATASGQISAGPSSPAVAVSISGSDGEGELEDEDMLDANGFPNGKKRSPRALTGKHVRLGTGASPTTLHTLRLKIQERQRMKLVKKSIPAGSVYASAAAKKNAAKLKSRAK